MPCDRTDPHPPHIEDAICTQHASRYSLKELAEEGYSTQVDGETCKVFECSRQALYVLRCAGVAGEMKGEEHQTTLDAPTPVAKTESNTLQEAYLDRNLAVQALASLALSVGLKAGVKLDPANPGWKLLYIDLPTGQVSWHLPESEIARNFPIYDAEWDHHDLLTKQQRVRDFIPVASTMAQIQVLEVEKLFLNVDPVKNNACVFCKGTDGEHFWDCPWLQARDKFNPKDTEPQEVSS